MNRQPEHTTGSFFSKQTLAKCIMPKSEIPAFKQESKVRIFRDPETGTKLVAYAHWDGRVLLGSICEPSHTTGAVSTFYYFRLTLPTQAAHEAIVDFIEREPQRSRFSPPPLCMHTRREMDAFYAVHDRKINFGDANLSKT